MNENVHIKQCIALIRIRCKYKTSQVGFLFGSTGARVSSLCELIWYTKHKLLGTPSSVTAQLISFFLIAYAATIYPFY